MSDDDLFYQSTFESETELAQRALNESLQAMQSDNYTLAMVLAQLSNTHAQLASNCLFAKVYKDILENG